MESLYLLIPIALIIAALAVKLLWWAINNGQYDDLDTESQRILFDDKSTQHSSSQAQSSIERTSGSESSDRH